MSDRKIDMLTLGELGDIVSKKVSEEGITFKEAIDDVIKRHPYATTSALGKELNDRKKRFRSMEVSRLHQVMFEEDVRKHAEEFTQGIPEDDL